LFWDCDGRSTIATFNDLFAALLYETGDILVGVNELDREEAKGRRNRQSEKNKRGKCEKGGP
jgi:hypothetical protein